MSIIIVGGGGHAKVIADVLLSLSQHVLGFVDKDPSKQELFELVRLGGEEAVYRYDPSGVYLANGLGSVATPGVRKDWYETYKEKGYRFVNVVHPSSVIGRGVILGEGVQVMAGAVIQPGSTVGNNTLINTKATVDHDCTIGAHVHIAPGATLSGDVHIDDDAHIGTGASIIQGVRVGSRCIVGAGAVLIRSADPGSKILGVPGSA